MNEQDEADFVARLETLERRVGVVSDGLTVAQRLIQLEKTGLVTFELTKAMDQLQSSTDGLTAVLDQVNENTKALHTLDNKVNDQHVEQILKVEEVADAARYEAALTSERNRRFTTLVAVALALFAGILGTAGYLKANHEVSANRSYQHSQALASYTRCLTTTATARNAAMTGAATIELVRALLAAEEALLADPTQSAASQVARNARVTAYKDFVSTITATLAPTPMTSCQTFLDLANSLK